MKRLRVVPTALALTAVASLAVANGSGAIVEARSGHPHEQSLAVSDVAGFTKVGFTDDYLVVVNVLPGERMFTQEEFDHEHPTVGELALDGEGTPLGEKTRHVEAHVYARSTGLAVTEPEPILEVLRHDTNEVVRIKSVLMQDVAIGAPDIHFGDNVELPDGIDITVRVILGEGEEVVIDGRLD